MSPSFVSFKLFGKPPPKDSARSVRLSYIPRIQYGQLLFVLPLYTVALVLGVQTWVLIFYAVGVVIYVGNVVSLDIRIRRARQREQAAP